MTRARANLAAIKTLKRIEQERRPATPEEQKTLAQYSGWGGLQAALDEGRARDTDMGVATRAASAGPTGPSLAFTHEVLLQFRGPCVSERTFYAAKRTWLAATLMKLVNNPG